ncbi:MAG: chemotaxis protein CheW [Spirochaetales bacterium]|nr:chemotaxis protein CheW [Spirochaetales bacterium]
MGQYLTFELDSRRYGVRVALVNSVLDPQPVTPLSAAGTIVTGLTNVRGNVVPVFNPRKTLERTRVDEATSSEETHVATATKEDDEEGGIVIFEVENGTLLPFIGLEADRIGKVVNLEDADLSPVPDFLPVEASKYFEGFCFVGGSRHSIVNLRELTSRETLFGVIEGALRD